MTQHAVHPARGEAQRCVRIPVPERLDFLRRQPFRDAYLGRSGEGVEHRADLSRTLYMDSSAPGTLLLLGEHAEGQGARVVLERPTPSVERALALGNFEQLFETERAGQA